ncbi:MAG: hypothetical protein FGM24_07510 [Candidatus Kapabacteria bacterium]|nr:hypothetical protein [Candidatus Kapabacteria bacterium]
MKAIISIVLTCFCTVVFGQVGMFAQPMRHSGGVAVHDVRHESSDACTMLVATECTSTQVVKDLSEPELDTKSCIHDDDSVFDVTGVDLATRSIPPSHPCSRYLLLRCLLV